VLTNFRRRVGRSVLTVMAVALAATLLTALVIIAGTARNRVLAQLSRGGPLAGIRVVAAAPDLSQIDNDNARPGPPRDLDDAARQRIAALPDVVGVVPVVSAQMLVVAPDPPVRSDVLAALPPVRPRTTEPATTAGGPTTTSPFGARIRPPDPFSENVVGVELARADQLPITVLAGRLPAPSSVTEVAVTTGYLSRLGLGKDHAPAVVGTELVVGAPRVYQEDRVRFRSRWTRVTVVGVVAQEAGTGQILASIQQTRTARAWTAAGGDGGGRLQLPTSPYTGLFVVVRGLERIGEVRAQITDIGYSTTAPENLIASVQRYLRVVEIVLAAIGLIALVIAALGISNALLAAVRERHREIGVLKAIGARDRDVARVFLLEAGTLGFTGGIVGTVSGWAAALSVAAVVNGYLANQGLAGVHIGFPTTVLAGSVAGATVLALVAGTLPARRAAALPAREAMEAG
jgi:ABC-type antimicrobial peptide transport system permease subunit